MPTAAKLVAALFFAALGYVTISLYIAHLPVGSTLRVLYQSSSGIGLLCGWFISGPRAGRGYADAVGTGVRSAFTTLVGVLLLHSLLQMLDQSMKRRFDGPMEAVMAVFEYLIGYGATALSVDVVGVIVVGGIMGGLLTEFVGRRWS
jgi:hypothetical protein